LARDIYGIGFKTADKIARALGLPVDHPSRLEAALVFVLNQMSDEGHVYVPRQELTTRTAELLELEIDLLIPALERLNYDGRVVIENLPQPTPVDHTETIPVIGEAQSKYSLPAVYLAPFYQSEIGLAERLSALAFTLPTRLSDVPPSFINLDSDLSAEQQGAVRTALTHPISVLTGGPGTGKTTTIKALIAALDEAGKNYALASPTGRAAKRLSEATGHPASTLHRLLGYAPGEGFKFNAENPLPVDLLVVDEASMLDLLLANTLVKALQPGTHLLFVGDVDQLPSVGAGDVLRDIIASDLAPVTRLSAIFRQASGSQIITNAHRVNQGQLPQFYRENQDFFLFPAEEAEEAARWVQEVVSVRIPEKFGLNPIEQIQVLAPMYRGPTGVNALNERLQTVLNPPGSNKAEKSLFGMTFRQGDKVMQIRNNYDKEVYNGDIGRVANLDLVDQTLTIELDGRQIRYEWSEADQLVLAYAISVHKSQGSEFTAVVMPLVTAHYLMLQRNLLYTGITRAKRLCVLVGSQRAIGMAVHNNKVSHRYTALEWRLQKY
jgi:exodeoxyribonuclease V alpha subunit